MSDKTLNNTSGEDAAANVSDIEFWGSPDTFKLLSKASSKKEEWMKSTKAMQIDGVGCLVQVTTQNAGNVAEALQWIPSVKIESIYAEGDCPEPDHIIGRRLVPLSLEDVMKYQKELMGAVMGGKAMAEMMGSFGKDPHKPETER